MRTITQAICIAALFSQALMAQASQQAFENTRRAVRQGAYFKAFEEFAPIVGSASRSAMRAGERPTRAVAIPESPEAVLKALDELERLAAGEVGSAVFPEARAIARGLRMLNDGQQRGQRLASAERSLKDGKSPMAMYEAARAALLAGDSVKAKAYGEEYLKEMEAGSRLVFQDMREDAYNLLGAAALLNEDTRMARYYLKLAGENPSKARLKNLGPNFALARVMLEKGEREAVVSFFNRIPTEEMQTEVAARFQEWRSIVASGGTPDFGIYSRF